MRKNTEKNLTQETCPDRGSNPDPLRDRRARCRLAHSGGRKGWRTNRAHDIEIYSKAHSLTFSSLYLRHSSFSNPSVALTTSQLILQSFRCFTYVTAHFSTILSLLLRHRLFTYVTWRAAHDINELYYTVRVQLIEHLSFIIFGPYCNIVYKISKILFFNIILTTNCNFVQFHDRYSTQGRRLLFCLGGGSAVLA